MAVEQARASSLAAWIWLAVVLALGVHQLQFWRSAQLDLDVLALLPQNDRDPVQEQVVRRLSDAGTRRLIVMVGAPAWDDARRGADLVRTRLAAAHAGTLATQAQETGDRLLDFYRPLREMLLTDERRDWLARTNERERDGAALLRLYQPAAVGIGGVSWNDDPLGLWSAWLTERLGATPLRERDGHLWLGSDGVEWSALLLDLPGSAFAANGATPLDDVLSAARTALHGLPGSPRLLAAGVPLFAEAAASRANMEIQIIGTGSLIAVLLLVWLTFRSGRPIVLVGLSLLIGCAAGLSVTALVFGSVHILTLVFGASLVGVAEDYGFHYFAARQGRPVAERRAILRSLLPGLALALLTSVLAYLALGIAPFPGLRQMALFSAAGLTAAFLTVVCWFTWLDTRELPLTRFAAWFQASLPRWPRWRPDRNGWLAAGALLVLTVAGIAQLRTVDDVRALQSAPRALLDEQREAGRLLDLPSPSQFFLVSGADAQVLLEREEALKARLRGLRDAGRVAGYRAVSDWLPSARRQQADLAAVHAANEGARRAAATQTGEAAIADTALPAVLTPEAWLASPAAALASAQWLGVIGAERYSVVLLSGVEARNVPAIAAAASGLAGVRFVDSTAEISELLHRYRTVVTWLLAAGYAAVLVALWWYFGRSAWRALVPTAIGSVAALAFLGFVGQPLQLFVVLALLLLLGMGVDYGIFLLEHPGDSSVWLAVALAGFSTLLSFGLLALSSTPALRAFGLTMLLGESLIWLLTPCLRSAPKS